MPFFSLPWAERRLRLEAFTLKLFVCEAVLFLVQGVCKGCSVVVTDRIILYVALSYTNDLVTRECKLIFKTTANENCGYLVTVL